MANSVDKNSITISKKAVQEKGGIVILPLKEYQRLCARAAPAYYLKGREAEELDKLVEEGLAEHKKGKTIKAPSLKDALRKYEEGQNKKY